MAVCMEVARKKMVSLYKETNEVDEMILEAERCLTDLFSDEPTTEEIAQLVTQKLQWNLTNPTLSLYTNDA